MVRLQPRDKTLMFGLSKYGVLSTKQIATWYFSGVDKHTVLRRLRILKSNQLILDPSSLPGGMKAWSLSKAGAQIIGVDDPFRYSNRNATYHDVTLSALRKRLEESGIAHNWTGDMQMKRELARERDTSSIVPDGLFMSEIKNKSAVVALELELHPKSHQRYLKIFNDYVFKSAVTHIFYVVEKKSIIKPLITMWEKRRKPLWKDYNQRLIIADFNEVIKDALNAKIHTTYGVSEPLGKVFKNNINCPPQKPKLAQPLGDSKVLGVSRTEIIKTIQNQVVKPAPEPLRGVPSTLDNSPST